MKVLIACEFSGIVRNAFAKFGHDAWSCDLRSTETKGQHIKGNALEVIKRPWDLIIAHPPCTDLAISGSRWFREKIADGRQARAIKFFMAFTKANAPLIAIENPICIMSSKWRKPDQIIQPWQFGHPENKRTCLWLKGLPVLKETENVYSEMKKLPINQANRIHYMAPGGERERERSRTYQGIANAFASQWGQL